MSPAIDRAKLGPTTTNRKWFFDVDQSTTDVPDWLGVYGTQEFKPGTDTTTQDTSDFSSAWKGGQSTALGWKLEGKVKRATESATTTSSYDPGQEILRTKAVQVGVAGLVHVRWYEMEPGGPRVESYEGYGTVTWTEEGGGMDALSVASFAINGDGERLTPTHPAAATAPDPVISTVTPAGQSVGEVVKIIGANFTGATAVTIDGTAASFEVASGTVVYASIPIGAAGAAEVIVTTAAGASDPAAYVVV
jgi:hypothetical protein